MNDLSAEISLERRVGVYGGSFDPVHLGHLRCALEVKQALTLDELRFIPSGTPPHRSSPLASPLQRIAMLEMAVRQLKNVVIDKREVHSDQAAYTIDTLASIASDASDCRLTLIIGMDQFSVFDTWHRWRELLATYDVAVMERPGQTLSETGRSILHNKNDLTCEFNVKVVAVTQLGISSSRIRSDLASGRDIRFLVPAAVRDYIISNGLYGSGQSA